MQIVIDIPEELYKEYVSVNLGKGNGKTIVYNLLKAIKNGTPLPKGHGRIADIDKVLEEMRATRTYDIPFALERAKPIIEADGGEA